MVTKCIALLLLSLLTNHVLGLGVEVEDVTGKQLEAALQTEEILAVMFYSKNCKTCDRVLSVLERVGEEVAGNGITLVRINDKKASKVHGIRNYPALSLFKMGEAIHYEGDMLDADGLLDFLSSPDALDVPGQVEDVTAAQLEVLVQQQSYLAVFFYDPSDKTSMRCLASLENIDDDLDSHGIPAVKMSDVQEARQYGVKSFPSIIVFVKRIPELYQGDVTNEAAVLEWVLFQAGIKAPANDNDDDDDDDNVESVVEDVMEEIDEMFTFPGADAKPDPEPKTTFRPPKNEIVNKSEEVNEEATPEPLSEIVDIIKNDNNVVAFFSADENHDEEIEVSCWPLSCASAKKATHKGLNIEKLTSRPVIRTGAEKQKNSPGWISWLLGVDLDSFLGEEVPDEEEEDEDLEDSHGDSSDDEDEDEEPEDEPYDIRTFNTELDEDEDNTEELEELYWYSVNLLGEEDWFSVDLLGSGYDSSDGRPWWDVNLLGGFGNNLWYNVDLFGISGGQYWYEVNLLGDDSSHVPTKYVCAEVDHDARAWYDVAWMGFCDDGIKHWYEVDLFGDPTVDQGFSKDDDEEEDIEPIEMNLFGIDLLGDYDIGPDERSWYDVDLYRDIVIPEIQEDEGEDNGDEDSGYSPISEVVDEAEEETQNEEEEPKQEEKSKIESPPPTEKPKIEKPKTKKPVEKHEKIDVKEKSETKETNLEKPEKPKEKNIEKPEKSKEKNIEKNKDKDNEKNIERPKEKNVKETNEKNVVPEPTNKSEKKINAKATKTSATPTLTNEMKKEEVKKTTTEQKPKEKEAAESPVKKTTKEAIKKTQQSDTDNTEKESTKSTIKPKEESKEKPGSKGVVEKKPEKNIKPKPNPIDKISKKVKQKKQI